MVKDTILQKQPNVTAKLIQNTSLSLTKSKHDYDTTNRECLTIEMLVLMLGLFLNKTSFITWEDQGLLKWIFNLAAAFGSLACRLLRLFHSIFDVIDCTGLKQLAGNAQFPPKTITETHAPKKNNLKIVVFEHWSKIELTFCLQGIQARLQIRPAYKGRFKSLSTTILRMRQKVQQYISLYSTRLLIPFVNKTSSFLARQMSNASSQKADR